MSNLSLSSIPRQVWGYYHPFYGTPDGPTGRWLTWNEPLWLSTGYGFESFELPEPVQAKLAHDPNQFVAPGRRSNYSAFYPTLGLYDVLDPKTLERHARWAVKASLDGLLWDYMLVGEDNPDKDKPLGETIYDRSFRLMLEIVKRKKIKLQLCPWYDSFCWYSFPVEKIADHLGYLARSYHGEPGVLHIDDRLAVYIYSTMAKHGIDDWKRIRSFLARDGLDRKVFLVAGELTYWKPDFAERGLFDGFGQYNYDMDYWTAEGVRLHAKALKDMAERCGSRFWSATVGPGFDGRIWHHPGRAVARGLGKRYEEMWQAAIESRPDFITVCSFNEWGEGTQIEPSLEYEDLYLRLTAKWAKTFKAGS